MPQLLLTNQITEIIYEQSLFLYFVKATINNKQ